jgi:hypothetical protein
MGSSLLGLAKSLIRELNSLKATLGNPSKKVEFSCFLQLKFPRGCGQIRQIPCIIP